MSNTETKSTTAGGGVGIAGLLGVVFVILKLTGVIAWSWLWVLAPFWIPIVIFAAFLPVMLVIAAAAVAKAMK